MDTSLRMDLAALAFLALAFVCLCVSCVSRYAPPTEPAEESRKALPAVVVKTRRTNGTFDTPDMSPWSLPIARKRWEFADSGGNLCVSEWMTIKAPPKPVAPVATEFPKLSEP